MRCLIIFFFVLATFALKTDSHFLLSVFKDEPTTSSVRLLLDLETDHLTWLNCRNIKSLSSLRVDPCKSLPGNVYDDDGKSCLIWQPNPLVTCHVVQDTASIFATDGSNYLFPPVAFCPCTFSCATEKNLSGFAPFTDGILSLSTGDLSLTKQVTSAFEEINHPIPLRFTPIIGIHADRAKLSPVVPNNALAQTFTLKAKVLDEFGLVLIVDLNGRGNFTTVQRAIDAVPNSSPSKTLIIVNAGVYREKVTVNKTKINIVMQGRGFLKTCIVWNDTALIAGNTQGSYSFGVLASIFVAYNISFKNDAPEPKPDDKGAQAVALRIEGDQAAFYGCGFFGWQDTIVDGEGRHFFSKCFIQGSVDFIYGRGRSLYQDCRIISIAKESTSGISGYITAQGRKSEDQHSGFSFVGCSIDGTGKVLLGRSWRPYATVIFANTNMSGIISPEGWSDWGNTTNDRTVTFREYKNHGVGANYKRRVRYSRQLTDAEASKFTTIGYIDGEEWLNQTVMHHST